MNVGGCVGVPVRKYHEWESLFRRCGVRFLRQRGSHSYWGRMVGGVEINTDIVAHGPGSDVLPCYIIKARRVWKLTKEDGVSDTDFYSGNWPSR